MKLEPWEREPFWLKLITPYLKKRRFPYLPEQPEQGKWYRIHGDDCMAANGDQTYADFQLGCENKLLIFFCGGGVSWNEYTAARPSSFYQPDMKNGYYSIQVDLFTDLIRSQGIFEDSERNPFRNWAKLVVTYDTGDFHCGAGDFPYTAADGSKRLCHHHGYKNYRKFMETVTGFVSAPEMLVVSGCSGGGFGAALLADDVMNIYPECENVTCLVDSAFFPLDDWHSVAKNVWHAPKEIVERIHTDNITLDVLQALYRERGKKVKILLTSSIKDAGLSRMVNLIKNGSFTFSRQSGEQFKAWLKEMMAQVQETLPDAGMYIFNIPDKGQKKTDLTIHCIIGEKLVFEHRVGGKTCAEWIDEAINGNVRSYGSELLD